MNYLAISILLFTSILLSSCETRRETGKLYTNDIISGPEDVYVNYLSSGLDSSPVIKSGKIPSHPDSQRWKRGYAKVAFTVNEKGKAQDIVIVDSEGIGFGGNTAYAVRFWRFHPAMKDGFPVPCKAEYTIRFRGLHAPGVND